MAVVEGSGIGMVVRKALFEPSCQMRPLSANEMLIVGLGSTGVIQFHEPVVFDTALKYVELPTVVEL